MIFSFFSVHLSELGGNVLVVSRHGGERLIGNSPIHVFGSDVADNRVPAFDVVIEEVERFAGIVGFEPERHLAKFHGERVEVNAIDAVSNHFSNRGAKS